MATRPEHALTVLTGATGFVGSLVLERLVARGDRVAVLVRAGDDAEAERRLAELAQRTWGDPGAVAGVEALAADIERERLGLDPAVYDALAARASAVVHCAASVRFDLPLAEAQAINVDGTEQVVAFAERARSLDATGRLVHVSTAFVHGRSTGLARERGPNEIPTFRNTYEQTKHRAEQVVARLHGAAIVRPSIVVGDSRSGWTSSFNVVYAPLRALVSGRLDVVPTSPEAILDLVPVDQVVDIVCALLDDPAVAGAVQGVGGPWAPTMEQFARLVCAHVGRPLPPFVPAAAEQIGVYAPYADVTSRFELARASQLGVRPVPIEELVPRMLDHATAAAWGRRMVARPSPLAASPRALRPAV